jgi:ATP-dependent Lon protease
VVNQSAAREALRFGLECDAPGQNVYVRGMRGTGRLTMVRQLLQDMALRSHSKYDRCYVHHFSRPDRPRLITLPVGQVREFRRRICELAAFIRDGLMQALEAEPYAAERSAIQARVHHVMQIITAPLEQDLAQADMALVSIQQGPVSQIAIFPLFDGQPVSPQQWYQRVAQDQVPPERQQQFETQYPTFQKRLQEISKRVSDASRSGANEIEALNEEATRSLLGRLTQCILEDFPNDAVRQFIEEITVDVIENRLRPGVELSDPTISYGVNIVLEHTNMTHRPIVEERTPSVINLLGRVEPSWSPNGQAASDYRGVHAGALLRADGGYLILNVHDLLAEPGARHALMRTLRTGRLDIVPPEVGWVHPAVVVQPEPINITVRVILIGDAPTYYHLDQQDPDFRHLFKVLADLDSDIDRSEESVRQYAGVASHLSHAEGLLPFHGSAVAALAEHGARIAARAGKLTARFGRIADIAREAAFLAAKAQTDCVYDAHVKHAVVRTKERAGLPSRQFEQRLNDGTIIIQRDGAVVGQINGLAVMHTGPLTYGFPARITATIGPGSAGLINIEGHAQMSGAIHTKGFHILGGLLRHLLHTLHPLAFSASLAFEQSYGGIDGDSASGAEACCLLSALTDTPIKQSLAMTGAIDQLGHLQAIGGVNEKVEGFFDACNDCGLTGKQGVIIPKANAGDLMLREDVVAACECDAFHIYAVDTIHEALELLTGMPAGARVNGHYPKGTLLCSAVERAEAYWRHTLQSPQPLRSIEAALADDDGRDAPSEPPYGAVCC